MDFTASTWTEFADAWDGVHNFLLRGECVPFSFDFPPLERIVDEVRNHPEARIGRGAKDRRLLPGDASEWFRPLPIAEALASPFSLAHFRLSVFDHPGGFLHGFRERVLEPWQRALTENGFTFDRCYPIVFIS